MGRYGGMGVSVCGEQQVRRLGGRPQTQRGRGTDLLALESHVAVMQEGKDPVVGREGPGRCPRGPWGGSPRERPRQLG